VTSADAAHQAAPAVAAPAAGPARAKLVLLTLIIVAAVANLPLAMANVALPSIGEAFDATQVQLNLVAVGYSLGLACSVLWLGALGDRYGRKLMCLLGVIIAIPAALIAGLAPSIEVLIVGRLVGGFAAGMAYPTTLSLIAALWASGPGRTKAIAFWAAIGGAISVCGPLLAGAMLEVWQWHSVFLIIIPVALVALVLALRFIPAHVNETTERVDNKGGMLSVLLVGALVLALNFLPIPSLKLQAGVMLIVFAVATVLFFLRQRRARYPLYDLHYARRPTFWVAAVGGIIVFGSLMGAMFIGQQFLQNVLGYSTVDAGLAVLPAGLLMVVVAPRSAKIVEDRGARFTLLAGYFFVLLGFVAMLVLWTDGIGYWKVALAYIFVGIGVGLAGTPASRSLTASVPVTKAGMASGTADLQRDLGGAIFSSFFGALLAAGYTAAATAAIAASPQAASVTPELQNQMTMSFAGAQSAAAQYPEYSSQILGAAKSSFLAGGDKAYIAGIAAVIVGAAVVFFVFPKHEKERRMLLEFHQQDTAPSAGAATSAPQPESAAAAD
jgi:MFS transporter, DHA2 family, multidrug resistance protein